VGERAELVAASLGGGGERGAGARAAG